MALRFWRSLAALVAAAFPFFATPEARAAEASDYLIDSWQTENGLPENSATSMVQTPDGYLWFGTFNGLVRFDGVSFTTFDPSNTPELPSPGIVNLHLESGGRLWISTLRGLVAKQDSGWTAYTRERGWTGDYVRSFSERAGTVCLTSFDGHIFVAKSGRLEELPRPPGASGEGFFGNVDSTGKVWVAQTGTLAFWDGAAWQRPDWGLPIAAQLHTAGQGRDGSFILVGREMLWKLTGGAVSKPLMLNRPTEELWGANEDSSGFIWLSSFGKGLYRIAPSGEIRHYSGTNALPYPSIRFVFEDRERNLWVGSSGGGLLRFKRRTFMSYGVEHGLLDRNVKAVAEDSSGQIIIGSYGGGLSRLIDGRAIPETNSPGQVRFVQCLLPDSVGRVWAGTYLEGLHILENGSWRPIAVEGEPTVGIAAIFEDSRGQVWVAGARRPLVFPRGGRIPVAAKPGLEIPGVTCFAEDPTDLSLWAANRDGVFRRADEAWAEVRDGNGNALKDIRCIHISRDGTLWLGGGGKGLLRRRGNQWSTVTPAQGLPSVHVTAILDDGLGYYWLACNRGVARVSPQELNAIADGTRDRLSLQLFNQSDGMASPECASGFQSTALRDRRGHLWFATLKGLSVVDPGSLRINTNPPTVMVEQISYMDHGGTLHEMPWDGIQHVHLPAGTREVGFRWTAICLSAPEKVRFSYKLKDRTQGWVEPTTRRSISVHTPVPTTLELSLRASNNDGVLNESPLVVRVSVAPHLWQTLGFWVFGASCLVGLTAVSFWSIGRSRLRGRIERLEHEAALRSERARLASVLETTSDLVGFADARYQILFVNRAGRELVGLGEEEDVSQLRIRDFFPEPSLELLRKEGIPTAMTRGNWSGECVVRHRNGQEIPVLQVIVAHRKPDGTLDFLSTIARNIGDRKRMELDLRLSEERFRTSMQHSPIGLAIVAPDGRFQEVNPALTTLLGYTEEQLLAIDFQAITHPEDLAADLDNVRRVLDGSMETYAMEKRYIHKEGHLIWAQLNVSLVRNADGTPRNFVAQIQDITERKRTEQEQRETSARYLRHETALSTLTRSYALKPESLTAVLKELAEVVACTLEVERVGIWTHDTARQILCSRELYDSRHSGHSSGTELTRSLHAAFFQAVDGSDVVDAEAAITDPRTSGLVESYLRPLGVRSLLAAPLHSRGVAMGMLCCEQTSRARHWRPDEITFAVAVANLLSMLFAQIAQQELESQLRQTQKLEALGTLAGGIAHDFNNILAAILSYTELARMEYPGHPQLQEYLAQVAQAGNRAAKLVRQILSFSRRQKQERRPIPLKPVVSEALTLLRSTLPATIEIVSQHQPVLPEVLADATQIHQVVMNLCTNAAHAMRERPGRLIITLSRLQLPEGAARPHPDLRAAEYVRLSISDNGEGMDEATVQRIFEPFFTTKPPGEGTGLGLAVVHGIVRDHEGVITVNSRIGRGTTFDVYLPAAMQPPEPSAAEPWKAAPAGHSERILFVDDEPALRIVGNRLLARLGYQPVAFPNASEAWAAFQAEPDKFAAVLSDLTMPGLTGIEFAARVHWLRPQMPFILTSGFTGDLTEDNLAEHGVTAVVQKPLDYETLAATLDQVLHPKS